MNLTRRFDLAALAKGKAKHRPAIVLQPTPPRLAFEQALYRIVMQVLAPAAAHRSDLLDAAASMRSTLTQDAFTLSTIMAALRSSFAQGVTLAHGKVDSLFGTEGRRHDQKWMEQVNRVIGVDLQAVVRSADIAPSIELATQANVALIRGLADDVAKRIETTIIQMVSRGAGTKEIAKALAEIGGFTRSRAKLIAVDQAESFNAKLNQIRQEQAGITSYIWSTSRDRRVRPLHQQREGQRFRWDSPPSDGHPGQPVRCRCIARPVLDFDEAPAKRSGRARAAQEGLRAVATEFGLNP